MTSREVTVIVTTSNVQHGLWCDRCLLPSAISCDVVAITSRGASSMAHVMNYCEDCA